MRRRLISLVLCVACLLPICRPTDAHAVAGVDDAALIAAGGVALVGSLLIAGGAKFAANEDVQRVAQDIYDRYIVPSVELSAEVTRIVTDWRYAKSLGKRAVINVSARLWEAICSGPVETEVSSGRYGVSFSVGYSVASSDNYYDARLPWIPADFNERFGVYPNWIDIDGHRYIELYVSSIRSYVVYRDGVEIDRASNYSDGYFTFLFGGFSHDSSGYYFIFQPHFRYCVTFPLSFRVGYGTADISYPSDCDLIRPGDKSATVQLPSDLPGYAEDGTTVEMPVISLDQSDYIIADGDVISSSTAAEDVILDAATGDRVQADTDVSNPDKPIAGTGVLDWLKGILKGLLDTIIALLTAIRDGILSIPDLIAKAIAAIFVPSDAVVEEVQTTIDDKLPVIADVKSILGNLTNLMAHPDQAASGLALTTVVDLSKHTSGTWGTAKVNLLDASWFIKYKSLTDDIVVGLAWLVFLWRLYGALPNIIHGMSGGGGVVDDC